MPEKRYIDANKAKDEIDEWLDSVGYITVGRGLSSYGELIGCIQDTPTEAVVPVVKCKNCKNLMFSDMYGECGIGKMGIVRPDDFCSYGERKDGK